MHLGLHNQLVRKPTVIYLRKFPETFRWKYPEIPPLILNFRKLATLPLRSALTALEPDYGLHLIGDLDSPYHWKFHPLRHGRAVPLQPFRWPYVDLLFFADNATHVWNTSPGWPNECWPRAVVFPLQSRPFDGFRVPAPCDPRRALAVLYGDDARVCVSPSYSHRYEITLPWRRVAVLCSSLAAAHPFVTRRSTVVARRRVTVESLMIGNRTLHSVTLEHDCSTGPH